MAVLSRHTRRHTLASLVGALVVSAAVAGCSGLARNSVPEAAATSGASPAFASVHNSSFDVTVENQAGQPLLDVLVAIKPIGRPAFTKGFRRIEGGQKLTLALNDFTGNDGTPFSLRLAKPKEITVSAVDLLGKKLEMTTPWKQ